MKPCTKDSRFTCHPLMKCCDLCINNPDNHVAAMRALIVKLCRVQPHGTDIHCPVCKRAWTVDAVLHGGMTHAPGCLAASPLALQILAEEDQR